MRNWTPDGLPILTFIRGWNAPVEECERTGFSGTRTFTRVYPSGLLYQSFDQIERRGEEYLVAVNGQARFYSMSPSQIEELSFVLDGFTGQRADFRVKNDYFNRPSMFSEVHDFWFLGDESSQVHEILAALWEISGFEWALPQGGVQVAFKSPYDDELYQLEYDAFDVLKTRMSLDHAYVGYSQLWDFAVQRLSELKAKGASAPVLLRNALVPYAFMDEFMHGDLGRSEMITQEMYDEIWNQVGFILPDKYTNYLGREPVADDFVPPSDIAMWGYLSNLSHWLKDNAPEALEDPLLITCSEICQAGLRSF
jgi:hypothetical protein